MMSRLHLEDVFAKAGIKGGSDTVLQVVAAFLTKHRQLRDDADRGLTESEIQLLTQGGFAPAPSSAAVAEDILPLASEWLEMKSSAYTAAEAATLLGVQASRIRQKLADRSLYGIAGDENEWRIPCFQFHAGKPLPGLERVLRALDPELHPLTVQRFFTTPQPELESEELGRTLTPTEWLIAGYSPDLVARIAQGV